jgi:hypothetical protein
MPEFVKSACPAAILSPLAKSERPTGTPLAIGFLVVLQGGSKKSIKNKSVDSSAACC